MDPSAEGTLLSPEEQVFAWRYLGLLEAGFSEPKASVLALRCDIDLHAACDLAARAGPELAFEIIY